MAEWIRKGLSWEYDVDGFLDVAPPIVVVPGQTIPVLDTTTRSITEGVVLIGSVLADSANIGFRMRSKEPQLSIAWTPFLLNLTGLTVPNEFIWTPRYGTVVPTPFGNLTIFSMIVMNEFYFKKGLICELSNATAVPINVYLWSVAYAYLTEPDVKLLKK